MKLKKLFAGVVAVAMMATMAMPAAMIATMSFPAFAAESNLKDGKIELTKTFTAANRGTTSQEEDFTFTITAGATVNGKRVELSFKFVYIRLTYWPCAHIVCSNERKEGPP